MADQFLAGYTGYVQIGASNYSFDKWKLTFKCTMVEVTSFTSGGYAVYVAGILSATYSVSGPYNRGNMAFSCGQPYTWNFGFTAGIYLQIFAFIETLEPDVDVKGRASVNISGPSSGSFLANIT